MGSKGFFGSGGQESKPVSLKGGQFQPYTYTSLVGSTELERDKDRYTFSQEIDPRLQQLYGQGLDASSGFLSQYLEQAQAPIEQFDFQKGIDEATQEYFTQQQAALDPVFAQQRQQLQSDLFGSGRMGLMLAGETAGAGAGGMVQPDAFGLSRGQSQALQEAYAKSRAAAVGEQQQAFDQAQMQYTLNQAAQQQQLANLLGGYQGAFGTAGEVIGIEQGLVTGAAEREGLIRQAFSGAMGQKSSKWGPGLGYQAANAFISGFANKSGQNMAPQSDIKLKENIKKVGEQNGFNIYTWDWNDLAKSFGIENQPTRGVMAQEVMNVIPSAVKPHPVNGYLTVDYSKIGVTR